MPRMDGTGPMGLGAMSGCGRGRCADGNNEWKDHRGTGLGRGCGRGRRMGAGRGYCRRVPLDTKEVLLEQKELLEKDLSAIEEKLKTL